MPPRYDSVRGVFEEAQRGFQNHNELLVNMKKLHEKTTEDEFEQTFLWHLKRAMVVFNREPAVERIMDFVAKYATIKSHCRPQPQKVTGLNTNRDLDYQPQGDLKTDVLSFSPHPSLLQSPPKSPTPRPPPQHLQTCLK